MHKLHMLSNNALRTIVDSATYFVKGIEVRINFSENYANCVRTFAQM